MDISSSRREWYAESDYDPSPYEENARPIDMLPRLLLSNKIDANYIGAGSIVQGPGGMMGIAQSAPTHDGSITVQIDVPLMRKFREIASLVGEKISNGFRPTFSALQALYPSVPPAGETVRERALRLKQQPHSMAQDPHDFHFDHRGRRRY